MPARVIAPIAITTAGLPIAIAIGIATFPAVGAPSDGAATGNYLPGYPYAALSSASR